MEPGCERSSCRWRRLARLAGLVPLDRRLDRRRRRSAQLSRDRHVCVFDWSESPEGPPRIVDGGTRHGPPPDLDAAAQTRAGRGLATVASCRSNVCQSARLIGLVYLDTESGPTLEDLRTAAATPTGYPGASSRRSPGSEKRVTHSGCTRPRPSTCHRRRDVCRRCVRPRDRDAGDCAARTCRVSRACARRSRPPCTRPNGCSAVRRSRWPARGASETAAAAACDLGDLQLGRRDRCRRSNGSLARGSGPAILPLRCAA